MESVSVKQELEMEDASDSVMVSDLCVGCKLCTKFSRFGEEKATLFVGVPNCSWAGALHHPTSSVALVPVLEIIFSGLPHVEAWLLLSHFHKILP